MQMSLLLRVRGFYLLNKQEKTITRLLGLLIWQLHKKLRTAKENEN